MFRQATSAEMPMFSLIHKMNDIVKQNNKVEGSNLAFFLEVMPTPELALYVLDLCSYMLSGIRKHHFFYCFRRFWW